MGQAIIGGKSDGENQKKIYFLKCSNAGMMNVQENCNISPLGELSIARSAFVVIPIIVRVNADTLYYNFSSIKQ